MASEAIPDAKSARLVRFMVLPLLAARSAPSLKERFLQCRAECFFPEMPWKREDPFTAADPDSPGPIQARPWGADSKRGSIWSRPVDAASDGPMADAQFFCAPKSLQRRKLAFEK
jgi:hypothetical protein